MRSFPCHVSWVLLTVLLANFQLASSQASFDSDFCSKYTLGLADIVDVPNLYTDYKVIAEKQSIQGGITTTEVQDIQYSTANRQAMVNEYSSNSAYWFWIDEAYQDCVYDEQGQSCVDVIDTCTTVGQKVSFVTSKDGSYNIGTALQSFYWPVSLNAHKSGGDVLERSIRCTRHVTCAFDEVKQTTVATEWNIMNPYYYSGLSIDGMNLIVSATHHYSTGAEERYDYTNYQLLTTGQYGIQLPESQCTTYNTDLDSYYTLPKPYKKFSYYAEVDETDGTYLSYLRYWQYHEYNYDSQLYQVEDYYATSDATEKDVERTVTDFKTGVTYMYSVTNGYCSVSVDTSVQNKMSDAYDYWQLYTDAVYYHMGIYNVREVPAHKWQIEYPQGESDPFEVYIATNDWLKANGKDEGEFFPISTALKGADSGLFQSIIEYKNTPGYHIPDLSLCYDQSDIIGAQLILLENYDTIVAPDVVNFEYEFRMFLLKLSGILSSIRIARIVAYRGAKPESETIVRFDIMGKYVGFDPAIYPDTDPMTSTDAADKIRTAVDQGSQTFTLEHNPVTINLKKGSFATYTGGSSGTSYKYVDQTKSGYSSGSMAALALCMLIISLVLGVGAIFAYTRFFKSSTPPVSFGLGKAGAEA